MKQTMLSKIESPLLDYAISKLTPEVFSHPVWVRFSNKDKALSPETIQDIFAEAEQLQHENPSDACQVLLICAVHQNYAGQCDNALKTAQQALVLAERNGLSKEIIWATWGTCAVCFQEGNYEQAARYLEYLQAGVSEENEWILVDLIEIVKQTLLYPLSASIGKPSELLDDQSHDDLLRSIFDWLRQWGSSPQSSEPNFNKLRLQRVENNRLHPQQRFSRLRSMLSSIRTYLSVPMNEPLITKVLPQQPRGVILPSVTEEPSINVISHKFRPPSKKDEISDHGTIITAVVQMLGIFSITIQDTPVKLPVSRGLSLLKYIVLHHKQDTPREVLMDVFWPDTDPESARNNLNVAIHSLRQALRSVTDAAVIRFEDGAYGLEPNLDIWLDVDEFEQYIKEGQRLETQNQPAAAVTKYEIAINLYRGDFLNDSPYEDWTVIERERLQIAYLKTLDHISQIYFSQERYTACITQCQLLLNYDPCREDAHCRLMQCYSRIGQVPLALRQYQICTQALRDELNVDPAPETAQLYEHIRHLELV